MFDSFYVGAKKLIHWVVQDLHKKWRKQSPF